MSWFSQIREMVSGMNKPQLVSPLPDSAPRPQPSNNEGFFSRLLGDSEPIVFEANPSPTPMATPRPQAARMPEVKGASTVRPTPVPGMGFVERTPSTDTFLQRDVLPITRKAGIPDPVAAGQYAAEGRLGGLGAKRNNFFNIAAYDSNPNAAIAYDTPQEGIQAYADLIQKRYGSALQYADNPEMFLKEIEKLGYAGDPETYGKRSDSGFRSYTEFIMNTPEFKSFLEQSGF